MKAVILCGGQGTRIREETQFRPKPMVEIGGRPILSHIMDHYRAYGVSEFVLCVGYKGWQIAHHYRDEQGVTVVDTGEETMTGGRLLRARKEIGDEAFFCTYGDGLADVDLAALEAFHRGHGATATVTVTHPTLPFGLVEFSPWQCVSEFKEKPKLTNLWISAGFFVFEPSIFGYLTGDDCILEREPLERMTDHAFLLAYQHGGFFQPLDTEKDRLELNRLWDSGEAPWRPKAHV